MMIDELIKKAKENWLITIIIVVLAILVIDYFVNDANKTGLQNYNYYVVGWDFEELENTGVGRQFYYYININGHYVSLDFPEIKASREIKGFVKIVEDDQYDDEATYSFSFDSHKKDKITFYLTVKENGGISNAGSYAKFRITISISGVDDGCVDYDDYYSFNSRKDSLYLSNSYSYKYKFITKIKNTNINFT